MRHHIATVRQRLSIHFFLWQRTFVPVLLVIMIGCGLTGCFENTTDALNDDEGHDHDDDHDDDHKAEVLKKVGDHAGAQEAL